MKWKSLMLQAIPALVVMLCSSYAGAAGFQLFEQNASGIGNAYAGSAAVAENAGTIFFNPAGMTQLQAREISLGAVAVRPSFKFNNNGSNVPVPPAFSNTGTDGGDAGGWNYLPNAYLSWALTNDLYAGLGFSVPFGLETEYASNWWGRYQAIKFAIETYNVNPSLAYRVSDKVSFGFGVNWQRMKVEYIRQAIATAQVKLDADDAAWGWNVGALFQLAPSTRLGLSYRSSIKHTLEGDLSGYYNVSAKADIRLPDTFIISVTQGMSDRWELLGDLSLTRWSSVDTLNIIRTDTGASVQTLDAKWNDSWRFALGTNYKVGDAWKLKLGVAYDQSPVPDAEHRLVSLPDNDRIAFALGTQWKPAKSSALDIGLEYIYMKSPDTNNTSNGVVRGSYDSNALVLGAQYSIGI